LARNGQQRIVINSNQHDEDNIQLCVKELTLAIAPEKVASIIETFLEWQPTHWAQLEVAVQRADFPVVISESHLLRGSSATLGAYRLAAALQRLEAAAQAKATLSGYWKEAEQHFTPALAALQASKAELQEQGRVGQI
jgi:HPt (histidine-containing phosphotransfer) domain-containing protein